jgi:hypothetical protein
MSTGDTIAAWGHHVDGAVALTKMRGKEQFKDPMSHAVFRAVRTMMVSITESYLLACAKFPRSLAAFSDPNRWSHSPGSTDG